MKNTYKFKFSIVTAVYNTADYIKEMLESIINQDIGFQNNVQIILIDDGSTDLSLTICKKYKEKYPNNIQVLSLNHKGVSNARNEGLKFIEGKYVNFLDSDDRLELNALSSVFNFFEANYEYVDIVAIPLYFFDKESGPHILNYKFENEQIIDISEKYEYIQLSSSSTFIKSDIVKKCKFDEKLRYAEDADMITDIILKRGKYGVTNKTKYYYRRRYDNSSATQEYNRKEWYLDYITNFSINMIHKIDRVDPIYIEYVEHMILYDLQWRIFPIKNIYANLMRKERDEFKKKLGIILKKIKFKQLINNRILTLKRKIIFIVLKIIL